jgi:hypothetical protein
VIKAPFWQVEIIEPIGASITVTTGLQEKLTGFSLLGDHDMDFQAIEIAPLAGLIVSPIFFPAASTIAAVMISASLIWLYGSSCYPKALNISSLRQKTAAILIVHISSWINPGLSTNNFTRKHMDFLICSSQGGNLG